MILEMEAPAALRIPVVAPLTIEALIDQVRADMEGAAQRHEAAKADVTVWFVHLIDARREENYLRTTLRTVQAYRDRHAILSERGEEEAAEL
jgi:flagellar biosynthesis regulator FlaF